MTQVADIQPGDGSGFPYSLTPFGDKLLFAANDGTNGSELWSSDGTGPGTSLLKDINPGADGSLLSLRTERGDTGFFDGMLFFRASDGSSGAELWKTDGTAAGTQLVKDINPGSSSSFPSEFTEFNGELYFNADGGPSGAELWKTDGTGPGTVLVKETAPGDNFGGPRGLTVSGGNLFFRPGSNRTQLWKSDGTDSGTVLVKDFAGGFVNNGIGELEDLNGTLLFSADDGDRNDELWKSDGTGPGTVLVKDLFPGTNHVGDENGGSPRELTLLDDVILFSALDGSGRNLWRSDGTTAGTTLVKGGFATSFRDGSPHELQLVDGTLYFDSGSQNAGTNSFASGGFWKSDGTPAGTVLITDQMSPFGLHLIGGRLLLAGDDAAHGFEPWTSDGTTGGTTLIRDLSPGGTNPSTGNSLDGVQVRFNGASGPFHDRLASFDGSLFFTGIDGGGGLELYRTVEQTSPCDSTEPPPDTTPPDTSITSGPRGPTNDRTPTFGFSATEAGSTFRCRTFEQGAPVPFGPCSGPGSSHTTDPLARGKAYVFQAQARDASNNTDPTPASRNFTVRELSAPPPPAPSSCKGQPATIIGTQGKDDLVGTPDRDVISAGSGRDTVRGLGGDDLICAGPGKDGVRSGSGDDRIFGEQGADDIKTGSGDDEIHGNGGRDKARGGSGADFIQGGNKPDNLKGNGGDDRLRGRPGNDELFGGSGDDNLGGNNGRDLCAGGGGRKDTAQFNCEKLRGIP